MHVSSRFRTLIVLLVIGISGGRLLLDGCLVSCDPAASKNARTAHCHSQSAPMAGPHLESIARCCHDGPAAWADASEARVALSTGSCLAIAGSMLDREPPTIANRLTAPPSLDLLPAFHSSQVPLRL